MNSRRGVLAGTCLVAASLAAAPFISDAEEGKQPGVAVGRRPFVYTPAVRHVIVTRFSVPRPQQPNTAERHADRRWLEHRIELFRNYFVPSVGRLGIAAKLLCSTESAPHVTAAIDDLEWAEVVVQDDWHGGWSGSPETIITRLDSDDAVHEAWFRAAEAVPPGIEVCCTKGFLRFDIRNRRLCAYRRDRPSPLAAFRSGLNPYEHDHADLERHYRTCTLDGPYLVQIYHGGNLSSRAPKFFRRRLPLERLAPFGIL